MMGTITSIRSLVIHSPLIHYIEKNRYLSIALAVAAAFIAISKIYRQLHHPDTIPFDHWTVSLGLSTQTALTDQEVQNLSTACETLTPIEFARRLQAYAHKKQNCPLEPVKELTSFEQHLVQICALKYEEILKQSHSILPSFRERFPLTLEDEKASVVQTWAMTLQPVFAVIRDDQPSWKTLLQPILSSPRLVYTILFNCIAPFIAQMMWEDINDFLPYPIQGLGSYYVEHKGKIALACLGVLAVLYYQMRKEKGVMANLTENFALSRKVHKNLDLIPSYSKGIDQVLRTIGMASPGEAQANILWYYPTTHRTFMGEIGEVLGEITATGRVREKSELVTEFPQLKKLNVTEFNVKSFLTEYRDKEEVAQAWPTTLTRLTQDPHTLFVFTQIDDIMPYLIPRPANSAEPEDQFYRESSSDSNPAKILSDLILLALRQGKFRCLIELSEEDQKNMIAHPQLSHLFTAIRAPDISVEDLEKHCSRLYAASDISCAFSSQQIHELFVRMSPVLKATSIHPDKIMEVIRTELKAHARSWTLSVKPDSTETSKIAQAERNLRDTQELKERILQKLWKQRREQEVVSEPLLRSLLLLNSILLPIYREKVDALKSTLLTKPHLLNQAQQRFGRLFGPCSYEEKARLLELPRKLKKSIKGQQIAIEAISNAILMWRKIPPHDGKPLVLFFAGPSGVGKSETATRLAFELNFVYGINESTTQTDESNVRRINLNRNKQGGIFGWDKIKAQILLHLQYTPASVIIFEEWDKMDQADMTALLELLDGTQNHMQAPWQLSSTNGPYVDKSCATFIFTANISTDLSESSSTSGLEQKVEFVKKGIAQSFKEGKEKDAQAFLSRIDAVIPFDKTHQQAAQDLIETYLDEYETQDILPKEKREQVKATLKNKENLTDVRVLQRVVREAIFGALKENS